MQTQAVIEHIVRWLHDYAGQARVKGFIVGISGGIDSAVVSALAARTGLDVLLLEMPIRQQAEQIDRAQQHIADLQSRFANVRSLRVDLTPAFNCFADTVDVILMGVSRSGKTPTCLYLALQYGIRAANYPLTPDDLDKPDLPPMVKQYRNKIYGLTIKPERLADIREERRPNSNYASISTCKQEVADAQAMFRRFDIPFTNTTHKSVEELAASIMQACGLKRRF